MREGFGDMLSSNSFNDMKKMTEKQNNLPWKVQRPRNLTFATLF